MKGLRHASQNSVVRGDMPCRLELRNSVSRLSDEDKHVGRAGLEPATP
jgi:hypothetical protein